MARLTFLSNTGKKYVINDNDEIHRGGEGRIMLVKQEPNLVAKLYHKNVKAITETQFNFLSKLDKNLFVTPHELLLDGHNQIAGFTMQYLGKEYFPLSALFIKNFCVQNGITDEIKQKIALSLANAVKIAHQSKLVIGDLNQYNVLVNPAGDIKMIDVDSYQTPTHTHSGMLLEDIRDYLYGGVVNEKSDFYALSVLLFYQFTFTHPFKGVHKIYKSLAERIVKKLPVYIVDADLIRPKCYEPVSSRQLQQQFDRHYLQGERFLIDVEKVSAPVSVKAVSQVITQIVEKDLLLTPILQNTNIIDIQFFADRGYIETDELYLIYDAQNKGYLSNVAQIQKKEFRKIYITNKNIIGVKNRKLYHYKSETDKTEITNYELPADSIICQIGSILIVVEEEAMYWVYLDEIINNSIQVKRTEVFGPGFKLNGSLYQNSGGVYRIFYKPAKDIATVKMEKPVKYLYQQGNVAIVQYIENKEIRNVFAKIDGLNIQFANYSLSQIEQFAFMPTKQNDGYIFSPSDNKIKVIQTTDFQQTSEMECSVVTEQSKLQYAKAGIIAWEGKSVYLLNKK